MTNQQKIARKAVRTRQARDEFRQRFGQVTYDIVSLVRLNVPSDMIAKQLRISASKVAAVRANLTRGTYKPYVSSTGRGSANI